MYTSDMNARPKKWPLWWRNIALLNIALYNFIGNAFAAGVTPLFSLIMMDLNCTIDEVSHLATYALLSLGLSNLFALPAASIIGSRYTILFSLLIFFFTNIWSAKASTYNSLLATRFVGGLSAGITEALGPRLIHAMYPETSLSRAMSIYASFLAAGSTLGPFFSGRIAGARNDWRWFFWALAAITGGILIATLLMLPEPLEEPSDGQDNTRVCDEGSEQKGSSETTEVVENLPSESATPVKSLWRIWFERSFYVPSVSFGRLSWNPLRIIRLLFYPQVLVAILLFGQIIGWGVGTNIILTAIFQSPPLLWSAKAMGNFNLSVLVGIALGIIFGGPLSDWLSRRYTSRTGHHKPEARLPALIVPGIVCPIGLAIIGVYLSKKQFWIAQAVGVAMVSVGNSSAATTILSYAIDSFPALAGEISVLINVFKNLFGFGLSYGAISWMNTSGVRAEFGTMAGLLGATFLSVAPLYFYGPRLRKRLVSGTAG